MAVNKVEYKLDSTVAGFASAGDEVAINKKTAKTIETDSNENRTEKLSFGQLSMVKNYAALADDTTYDVEGGEEDLTTDGTEGEEGADGTGKMGNDSGTGEAVSTMANLAGLGFASVALAESGKLTALMCSPIAPGIGMADIALGAASIVGAKMFDSDYNNRLSEASASSQYISDINEYTELLNQDIETMTQAAEAEVPTEDGEGGEAAPVEASGGGEEGGDDAASVLGLLKEILVQYEEDGNQEMVEKIENQIAEIEASLQPAEGAEGEEAEDPVESVIANNGAAHDMANYTTEVSSFLKQGKQMGTLAAMNTAGLAGCAALSGVLAAKAWLGATPFTIANSIAGAAMCGVGAALFGSSALMMTVKTVKEFHCGSKGDEVGNALTSFNDPLQQHDEIVEKLQAEQEDSGESAEGESAVSEGEAIVSEAGSTSATGGDSGSSGGGSSSPAA